MPEVVRPFENLLNNLRQYTRTVESLGKEIFWQLTSDIKKNPSSADGRPYPQLFMGQIEDIVRERMEFMTNLDSHEARHQKMKNTFKRQSEDILTLVHELINDNDEKVKAGLTEKKRTDKKAPGSPAKIPPKSGGSVSQYHLNGKLKYKGPVDEKGQPHGVGSSFHYNGNLEVKGEFVNGKITGDNCKVYHFNGNLQYDGPIEAGLYQGPGKLMHENAQLKYSGVFNKGQPHQDDAKLFYDNAQIDYKGDVTNGVYDSDTGKPLSKLKNSRREFLQKRCLRIPR